MSALAHDLAHLVPDLAGQFEESLPGTRRNTGSGLFTETIVSSRRPLSDERATGRFGTVHAMVGDLPDPIAFQVELRDGRLLALHGDAYGQDTRGVDFAHVRFDQIFTVNDQGVSIAYDPVALTPRSPLLDLQDPPRALPPPADLPLVNIGPLQRLQDTATRPDPLDALLAPEPPANSPLGKDEKVSLIVGLWVTIGVVAIMAIVVFDVPPILAGILGIFAGRSLQTPKGLALVKRGMEAYRQARANQSA